MNFYQYNLGITPGDYLDEAALYLKSILTLIAKQPEGEVCKELLRKIKSMKLIGERKKDVKGMPKDIVTNFEYTIGKEQHITNWSVKVARYLAYSVDGGLLQSSFTLTTLVKLV